MGIDFFQKTWNGIHKRFFLPLLRRWRAKRYRELESLSLITSNCIGGVLSNSYGLQFKSPTVNLYMNAADYASFAENLEVNLRAPLVFCGKSPDGGYPIGRIGNCTLHLVHYPDFQSAKAKWTERAGRVELSKVVLILCERDGCTPEIVERFARLPYPKILLAKNKYPYDFSFFVKPTRWEKRLNIDPMDRLLGFGCWGKRRFEKYITADTLIRLAREGL